MKANCHSERSLPNLSFYSIREAQFIGLYSDLVEESVMTKAWLGF